MQHVTCVTLTRYLSVPYMNYIKQLQADKAKALDSARSIETEINHLISYLRRRHETEFKARRVPLLPRESAKKPLS